MEPQWQSVVMMEQFVVNAAACGFDEHDLQFARLAVEIARTNPPKDISESIELWHKVRAHGEVVRCPMHPCATYLAALAWREAHLTLCGIGEPKRRWWRREPRQPEVLHLQW